MKRSFSFLILFGLTLFLILNIVYSQNLSPLYFRLTEEDKTGTVDFLKKAKKILNNADFNNQLSEYQEIYGNSIKDEVYKDETLRKQTIRDYQEILERNSASRDALYNLYLLTKEDGNTKLSQMYFKKAKQIDPMIGK